MKKEREVILQAIKYLKKDWGADCPAPNLRDVYKCKTKKDYTYWLDSRCQSCRAKEVIQFLEKHLSLLEV
jgi:hypothetical protein